MTSAQRSPTNLKQAASICRELGYLALAVAQAGAYIGHSCSLDDYLHIYWEDSCKGIPRILQTIISGRFTRLVK